VNVDFPDVILVRKQLIVEQEREKSIACDLKDYSWMEEVDGTNGLFSLQPGCFIILRKMK